ncbi:protein containg methyltransferase domain [Longilinea arvoryzae]|uniref:Protein containg methyltransferase domain n=1 Tax=Longilinea arvoryzae TaxID=360412 RepID=A0A0S7BIQ9_9CHLR|nr:class I SAM-dependent methyltransferase [Longilinea arvoryzae]GAP13787.1 protein containg methyltransferase domain [Longilinea arvoryzae]
MSSKATLSASFRDPSGFLFRREGVLYRQVNQKYQPDYDQLMHSGLYQKLVNAGLLIPHTEVDIQAEQPEIAYRVLRPEVVPFISYPYEWSFGQLKDAAMATLAIARQALDFGMLLKDASAYNIQYHLGKPVLIDTLSFEVYQEGRPWVAYRQFCQHFLAPLALMAFNDVRLNQLLRIYIDGVPLDLASKLLPGKTRLNFGLASHIHMHANAQKRYADQAVDKSAVPQRMAKISLLGLLDNLESTVRGLSWTPEGTEWADYYDATNYTREAFEEKKALVLAYIQRVRPAQVWDLGANNGEFSRLATTKGINTVAFDIDPSAVEKNYRAVKANGEQKMLPLVLDLTNPSPSLGWENRERQSLAERGPVDLALALALVHHLAISNNVPLDRLAAAFAALGRWLVIEFVPKEDSQVQRLLATREDIFPTYTLDGFEEAFSHSFDIVEKAQINGSKRTLFLMKAKED